MKTFPSIPYHSDKIIGQSVIAFDKLDGTNIRYEWSKKRGWYKFGTKKVLIDASHNEYGEAITLFQSKYAEQLEEIFRKHKDYRNTDNFVVFCEYVGKNSFAGWHDPNDKMDVVLLDVNQYKKGFISPKSFVENFSDLHIPEIIFQGMLDNDFITDIRSGKYALDEGVIIKGVRKTKGQDITWMAKVKTNSWLKRLKNKFGEEELLKELNNDKALFDLINNALK